MDSIKKSWQAKSPHIMIMSLHNRLPSKPSTKEEDTTETASSVVSASSQARAMAPQVVIPSYQVPQAQTMASSHQALDQASGISNWNSAVDASVLISGLSNLPQAQSASLSNQPPLQMDVAGLSRILGMTSSLHRVSPSLQGSIAPASTPQANQQPQFSLAQSAPTLANTNVFQQLSASQSLPQVPAASQSLPQQSSASQNTLPQTVALENLLRQLSDSKNRLQQSSTSQNFQQSQSSQQSLQQLLALQSILNQLPASQNPVQQTHGQLQQPLQQSPAQSTIQHLPASLNIRQSGAIQDILHQLNASPNTVRQSSALQNTHQQTLSAQNPAQQLLGLQNILQQLPASQNRQQQMSASNSSQQLSASLSNLQQLAAPQASPSVTTSTQTLRNLEALIREKTLKDQLAAALIQNNAMSAPTNQTNLLFQSLIAANPASSAGFANQGTALTSLVPSSLSFAGRNQSNESRWKSRYEELVAFRQRHGHCRVPHGYQDNRKLSWWVMNQRAQFQLLKQGKKSWLTEDRVMLLNLIDFDWNPVSGKSDKN